jgi:hypothetical protein
MIFREVARGGWAFGSSESVMGITASWSVQVWAVILHCWPSPEVGIRGRTRDLAIFQVPEIVNPEGGAPRVNGNLAFIVIVSKSCDILAFVVGHRPVLQGNPLYILAST